LSDGCGRLLRTLQIRRKNLLDIGISEHLRQTFSAPVSFLAKQRIGRIGNLVRMSHQKNRAHTLGMRMATEHRHQKGA